ncbi:GNAT family N-acetyltransferase [Achromobacter sp. F4_2707]|uniref:GNAT family N-acetyltransferase n=1 Tax=Achromobacter sp. F4_2707 TaxID=3114286 RepID=UPI0039C7572E
MTTNLTFREAETADLPELATLLSDDPIGASRDGAQHLRAYEAAFKQIQAQAGNTIIVAVLASEVVGMLQLTLIPGLSRGGMLRAQIESVRVRNEHRGKKIGQALLAHAIAIARDAGCGLVQLTSDKQRHDALRFYEALGFTASHEGMKLLL